MACAGNCRVKRDVERARDYEGLAARPMVAAGLARQHRNVSQKYKGDAMNRRISRSLIGLVCAFFVIAAQADGYESSEETRQLREQIELMQQQLVRMQQRLDDLESEKDEIEQVRQVAQDQLQRLDQVEEIDQRVAQIEQAAVERQDGIDFGGAVRLNYAWRDFDEQNKDRFGDFEMELFRINVSGSVGDVLLDAEWRRYNDFQAIHHAWVGYNFNDALQMQVGITQTPFGILPFASHSFWFGGTYYLGFEDDYDTGVKFVHTPNEDWTFHYAFFKNPEFANDSRFGRYSFDLVTSGEQQNSETNQLNLRAERHLVVNDDFRVDLGISGQAGQIYNRSTEKNGDRWAVGLHADAYYRNWNLQLQGIRYEYNPDNPDGVSNDFVQKGAFDFPFLMAAEANVVSANIARSFNTHWGPITGVTCYNNFTWIDPDVDNSAESIQNVTGCSVAAGGMFTYFDWIAGKNMWFAGGDGIGLDATTAGKWRSRLNINIGYYF